MKPYQIITFLLSAIFIAILIAILVECGVQEQGKENTSNPNIQIDFLFEHDGCRIYRFFDAGKRYFFSDCRGRISGNVSCGKNCEQPIQTENFGS